MENKIQELTEKIYAEGVEKGKAEADRLVCEAKESAAEIVRKAQAEAEAKQIAAEAEAKANATIAASISEPLLKKMEMEARQQHGWVEVAGGSVVTTRDD